MLVKKKIKPKAIHAESGMNIVRPIHCTDSGELVVYQVNNPDPLNVQLDPDGTVVVRDKQRTVNVEGVVKTKGTVSVDNTLTVEPVTVSNMPDKIQIQEPLHIQQISIKTKMLPFNFSGCDWLVISNPCKIYSIYLTVREPTFVEIVGITGKMWVKEKFQFNLFPLYVQVNELQIKTTEYVNVGGYVLCEN